VPDNGVAAWISIGIVPGPFDAPDKLRLPVLDIYGERDLPQVLKSVDARAVVLRKLKGSAQIEVAGADHYFNGSERELVKQARLFLDQRLK
jgi:pimeloyl-ACP methyl ester carboxylesterase